MQAATATLVTVASLSFLILMVFLAARLIDLLRWCMTSRQTILERENFNRCYPIVSGGSGATYEV